VLPATAPSRRSGPSDLGAWCCTLVLLAHDRLFLLVRSYVLLTILQSGAFAASAIINSPTLSNTPMHQDDQGQSSLRHRANMQANLGGQIRVRPRAVLDPLSQADEQERQPEGRLRRARD
jgi:hypothetical protein